MDNTEGHEHEHMDLERAAGALPARGGLKPVRLAARNATVTEAAATIRSPQGSRFPAAYTRQMSDIPDPNLPFSPSSAAYTLSHALSWTSVVYNKTPDGKLRWAAVSAQLLLQALEQAFELSHPGMTREDIAGLIGKTLFIARDRPDAGWVERQPWAHDVTSRLIAILADHVVLERKLRVGSARRVNDLPTWR